MTINFPIVTLTAWADNIAPTSKHVRTLTKECNQCVSAVPTTLGGGAHGHLGLITPTAAYAAIDGTAAWEQPETPVLETFDAKEKAATVRAAELAFNADTKAYNDATAVEAKLKQMLLAAIPPAFIQELEHSVYGYSNVTCKQIIAHLTTNYGTITPEELDANIELLQAPIDLSKPLEERFALVKDCRQFATDGGDPITEAQAIRYLMATFRKSGVFGAAIHEWAQKATNQQTLTNLRTHFLAANKERLENNDTTASIFGTANLATEVALAAVRNAANANAGAPVTMEMFYCWTHGLGYNPEHTSATCSRPADGHCRDATCADKKGGNNLIARRRNEVSIYVRPDRRARDRSNAATTGALEDSNDAAGAARAAPLTPGRH